MIETAEPKVVTLDVTLAPTLNLAFFQNAVAVIREIAIGNDGEADLEELELRLSSAPAFLTPKLWRIDRVASGGQYHLPDLDVTLDGSLLAGLTEAETAEIAFELTARGEPVATLKRNVELLARNQWAGINQVPELLAAFVQPNDPAVDRLLKSAAQILKSAGKNPALNGYEQASKARSWELGSALWSAVQALGLDYALPPASFETSGQKVRLPGQILDSGIATCLDLTLLFAAGIEQIGMNPIVVFTAGHAFTGFWLKPEQFTTVAVDDVTALRKRMKLEELVLFETTLSTGGKHATFGEAIQHAARAIAPERQSEFALAVDIRRARMSRVKPLSSGTAAHDQGISPQDADARTRIEFEEAPSLVEESIGDEAAAETPAGRLERWQRKLLDLSLRNNLLNFRASKRALNLYAPDPGALEDRLAAGRPIKVRPRPPIMEGADPRSVAIHQARHGEDPRERYALEALAKNEILVALDDEELDTRLVDLFRSARTSLQEGGANTLFLALGFLHWKREPKEERAYRAPLILVPVQLERKSVRSGFNLVIHEDEPRFNPTLIEMLRQDFNLKLPITEGELPKDESGLDIRRIWKTVQDAIKEIPGWEVREDVVISTFSFAKYLMWKDLAERTEQLKSSPVVKHLIETPRDPYGSGGTFLQPEALDFELDPVDVFCPLPADSSQLTAVTAATIGKDFVLKGPPGTGKSQTIANMIAQCLADGKTVLFVSEKIAALEVVYSRLRANGLSIFCLELHSSKAKKADVLAQLKESWAVKATADQASWTREAARLKALRDGLNRFVQHLHKRHLNGLSARQAIATVVAGTDLPEINLSWPSLDHHDEVALDALRGLADRLQTNVATADVDPSSPLLAVETGEWSPSWQQKLIDAALALGVAARNLREESRGFVAALSLDGATFDAETADARRRDALLRLARILTDAAGRDWRFVLRPDARSLVERLEAGTRLVADHVRETADLSIRYRPEATKADLDTLTLTWGRAEDSWWPKSAFLRRRVGKALASLSQEFKARPICRPDLEGLTEMRRIEDDLAKYEDLAAKTGGLWSGLASNCEEIAKARAFGAAIAASIAGVATDAESHATWRSATERLLGEANALLEPEGTIGAAAARLREKADRFDAMLGIFVGLTGIADPTSSVVLSKPLTALIELCDGIVARQTKLNAWCAWRRVRAEAIANGLGNLVDAIERGSLEPTHIVAGFEVAYARWWLNCLIDDDEALRTFVSAEHERRIEEFRKLDDRMMDLTRSYVRAKLAAGLPDQNDTRRSSEWGTLRHEIEKKRRHMPLRQLISSLPTALTKLAPCLLMSPLSIAQYLPAGQQLFDVVIFDEASQIPVWDAVGAIARGKQAIIVGDPKQLPPTSFFARAEADDSDADVDEGDLESILDECLGANLPTLQLNWHYRSRHESLIAFSNHRYYGGGLVTFPSPVTEDRAVSFHHVPDAVYERGGGRINKPEAKAIVADVVGRLKDPTFVKSRLTIGVVTFNAEQQKLIEDLLDLERRKDPGIEVFFEDAAHEPLFIKNLESVQGDERDIMYFSITYGPDLTGHFTMNFGPMNGDGGERRLNVAVTRARHELRVFCSFMPEQINLSRTQALGVRDLKHFLEFAQRGSKALAEAVFGSVGDYESPFEHAVAAAMTERGWQVHPQIGVSSFRVDLGVVHPDHPGTFLAGVECDGATYHRAATARDRDKLRESILTGLGWNILRI